MKHIKKYFIFESSGSDLSDNESRILDLIQRNKENWIKSLSEANRKGKLEKFMDHYRVINLIQKAPAEMTVLLYGISFLKDWFKENSEQLPEDFLNDTGLFIDLTELGFDL